MRFPVYFKRRKGAGALPLLGSDPTPTFASSPPRTAAPEDGNLLSHKLQRPLKRVAVGYWYEGAGAISTLPVALWAFDTASERWYKADSGTLANGEISYFTVPALLDPPTTTANLGTPQNGVDVLIVVGDNALAGDGTFHFVAGPDAANY